MEESIRILYAPPNVISWDAQFDRGFELVKRGYTVHLHEHSIHVQCGQTSPNGAAPRCGQLTVGSGQPTLEPVSEKDN